MKNLYAVILLVALIVSRQVVRADVNGLEDKYNVYLFATNGPLKTNVAWKAWASGVCRTILTNHTLPTDFGNHLSPSFISQDTRFMDGKIPWFPVLIEGKKGNMISLNMLRFGQKSSDSANSLANSYSLIGGSYAYSSVALGIIYSHHGAMTILESGEDGSQLVDAIIFIGLQSVYYTYSDDKGLEIIANYSLRNDLSLTTWVEIVGANSVVLGRAARTLQTTLSTPPSYLTIRDTKNGQASIVFKGSPDRTGVLQSAPTVKGPWVNVSTVNHNDEVAAVYSSTAQIFRAVLQPAR